ITIMRLVAPATASRKRSPDGERSGTERNLAILFVDTRGFTAFSEKRLPYDIVFVLNRLFAEIGEAIEAQGGVIDKYLGDGLMAIFGMTSDDAAGCRQALRAVRDIDLALDTINRELESEIGAPLRLGMGLEVGPLVVGRIGHVRSASLTVIGNTVNTASRLESLSKEKGCQLVVSTDVLARAGLDAPEFPREVVAIRGLTETRQVALVPRARDLPIGLDGRSAKGDAVAD
ncbi:MAG: adenylate/guanylate cyclase domain-containing protein, partial [Proteobacteria bacterium]|nr:adenylate/guanylate cyclase domain-containing protein [Pseudomonadota bacterium]